MVLEGESGRKRAYAPKTRSGCKTCKVRRIKCDETKPFCRRCTSTGRNCDGYPVNNNAALIQQKPITILPKGPLTSIVGSLQDEAFLDIFRLDVAPKIAGFYGNDFWTETIVKLAFNEPSIRLAIQAVSNAHDQVERNDGHVIGKLNPKSLRDYNEAIKHLVKAEVDLYHVNLAVVALFVCLEFLQGNDDTASIHINGGLKMLSDWRRKASGLPPSPSSSDSSTSADSPPTVAYSPASVRMTGSETDVMNSLTSIFNRLEVHSKAFGKRMLKPNTDDPPITVTQARNFKSFDEACDNGFIVLSEAMGYITRVMPMAYTEEQADDQTRREQSALVENIHDWRRAYKILAHREQMTLTHLQVRAGNMICCLNTCALIWANVCLSPYETQYDGFKAEFEEVIELSKTILDIPQEFLCSRIGRFQFDIGLIPALHLVGTRCRWPEVRKDAIKLLSRHHWREGLFDSFRSAQFIKACMDLEEQASINLLGLKPEEVYDAMIAEGARIHFVGVGAKRDDGMLLHSFYSKPFGPYGDWQIEQRLLPAKPAIVDVDQPFLGTKHMVPNSAFRMPHSKTQEYARKSNGMFYFHLVGVLDEYHKQTGIRAEMPVTFAGGFENFNPQPEIFFPSMPSHTATDLEREAQFPEGVLHCI